MYVYGVVLQKEACGSYLLAPVSSFLVSLKDNKTQKLFGNVKLKFLDFVKGVRQFCCSTITRKYKTHI